MNCEKAKDLILTDFIDGEVSPEDKRDLLQHLVQCQECRKLVDQSEEFLVQAFADAPRPTPSEKVWQSIEERLDETIDHAQPTGWTHFAAAFFTKKRQFALALAGGIVLIIVSVYHFSPALHVPPKLTKAEAAVLSLVEDHSTTMTSMLKTISYDTPLEKILF